MSTPSVRLVSVFSVPGARPGQEDAALFRQEKGIFVVADGFGGPVAGAAASKTACESVQSFLFKEAGDLDATLPFEIRPYFSLAGNVLFNALIHSNRKVRKLNDGKSVHERGGASVLAAFLDGNLLALANAGSCTAWMGREGLAQPLVTPRTYGRLLDPFHEETEEYQRVPLTSVGMYDSLEPEIFEVRVRPGDWLLLHTDGVRSDTRERVLALQCADGTPEEKAQLAMNCLEAEHFGDNATALLAIFE